jgi:hypothetical protein
MIPTTPKDTIKDTIDISDATNETKDTEKTKEALNLPQHSDVQVIFQQHQSYGEWE